ncbi:MAG TPA: hypothetical protein PKW36_14215, partial [bacterium]|nr:hypothetical protein [bacterium]
MKFITWLFLTISGSIAWAGTLDTISIGFSIGRNSYKKDQKEFFIKTEIRLLNHSFFSKLGVQSRQYDLSFDGVRNLKAKSLGLFAEYIRYLWDDNLFAGMRWELINFNRLTTASRDRVKREHSYDMTSFYTGTCIFLQIGFDLYVTKNLAITIYPQYG